MVGYKVNIRRLKSLMMSIYARYSNYFESKRNEYIGLHHSTYGADKFATTETVNEIERNEGFKVDPRSLKEAMARVSTRKPSKGNRTDWKCELTRNFRVNSVSICWNPAWNRLHCTVTLSTNKLKYGASLKTRADLLRVTKWVCVGTGFSFSPMKERRDNRGFQFEQRSANVLSKEETENLAKLIARVIRKELRRQDADAPNDEPTRPWTAWLRIDHEWTARLL